MTNDATRHILKKNIAVIGGGITGLAAAHRLVELVPDAQLTLFEASDRLGGSLFTIERDGFLVELGADSFITNVPWGLDLCRRIGLTDELIPTNTAHRGAAVVRRGRVYKVPAGFQMMATARVWPLLTSPLLSVAGRLRMAGEFLVAPRKDGQDESLAEFACRRLGREAFEWLVEPMISGIFTADARRLSVSAAVPQFVEMERRWGSLSRGMRQRVAAKSSDDPSSAGARYGLFTTPRGGMGDLVAAVVSRLPSAVIETNCPVVAISVTNDRLWQLSTTDGRGEELSFDGVIVAIAAPAAGRLVQDGFPELGNSLAEIEYATSAVVTLSYRIEQVTRPVEFFGLVVPAAEGRPILAASFSSIKFAQRAPQGQLLVRVFLGGALHPDLPELPDGDLSQLAIHELNELMRIQGDPGMCQVMRWKQAMPQYNIGHLARVERIEQQVQRIAGLQLAGNAYRGVGIPQCVRSGELAAERLVAELDDGQNL